MAFAPRGPGSTSPPANVSDSDVDACLGLVETRPATCGARELAVYTKLTPEPRLSMLLLNSVFMGSHEYCGTSNK